MKPEVQAAAAELAKKLNINIQLDDYVIKSPNSGFAITCETMTFSTANRKVVVTAYLFPNRNQSGSRHRNRAAKSLVLTFLTASTLESHIWREISRNFFVFTFPPPGGSPLEITSDARSILELASPSKLVN